MRDVSVTAADVSLFHLAARELGDAGQWWRIADCNGLSDPDLGWIEHVLSLKVPVMDAMETGGLPVGAGL